MNTLLSEQKNSIRKNGIAIAAVVQPWQRATIYLIFFMGLMLVLVALPTRLALAATTCQAQHLVQPGDTLAKIGQRYNVAWTAVAAANNITNPNRIYTGTYLCIPGNNPPTTPPPAVCQANHIVQRGETLSAIGLRHGVSWSKIAQANNLSNPNHIFVGQKLCIPSSSTQPPPTTPPPTSAVPTIKIAGVAANQTVTISTANFPANQQFDVLMGAYGTKGVNGTLVTSINSGAGGSFSATFNIPQAQHGADRIAIRLQSASGYYSFNWFHNSTTR